MLHRDHFAGPCGKPAPGGGRAEEHHPPRGFEAGEALEEGEQAPRLPRVVLEALPDSGTSGLPRVVEAPPLAGREVEADRKHGALPHGLGGGLDSFRIRNFPPL